MKLRDEFHGDGAPGLRIGSSDDARVTRAMIDAGTDKVWRHRFDWLYRQIVETMPDDATIFEIGVWSGASHNAWSALFPRGTIVGFDRKPRPSGLDPRVVFVRGDQSDLPALRASADVNGPFNLVVDDGSHEMRHQIDAFEILWPHVCIGGWYVCEDLHTSDLALRSPQYAAKFNPTAEPTTALDYFLALARETACRRGEVDEDTGARTLMPSRQFTFFSDAVAIRKLHDGESRLWP